MISIQRHCFPCATIPIHPRRLTATPYTLHGHLSLSTPGRDPTVYHGCYGRCITSGRSMKQRPSMIVAATEKEEPDVVYNKKFGYSRKDVLIIGVLTIASGYGLYYGLQFFGVDELKAGAISEVIVFVAVLFTWVITYLFRVGTKTTTYVTQLKEYEEAVMQKRLDEMTDAEVEIMMEEVEKEKQEAMAKLESQDRN